eukprot:5390370-Pyramimonas_sp.AAC.1
MKLSAGAKQAASDLADHDVAERGAKFEAWVEEQSLGGGGGLHAIKKVPNGFDPSPAKQQELHVPTDLAGEISELEKEWRRWWRCNLHQ